MRLIHTADLHIGVESHGHVDSATGLSSRLADFLVAFDALVDTALEQHVDAVLFCGDAYKSREPSPTHQREFAKRVARLAREGIAVFLLAGNHDMPNALGRATSIEIFETVGMAQVTVAQRPGIYTLETRSGPLQVAALPWPRRGDLLADTELRGLSPEQIRDRIEDKMGGIVESLAAQASPDVPAVLAAHVAVTTATVGSEQRMVVGADPTLSPGVFQQSAFDYVALGHYHHHQILKSHPITGQPWVAYSGSLQPVDFGEEGENKGYCVLTLDPAARPGQRLVDWGFKSVPVRAFVTLRYTLAEDELDPTGVVCMYLESKRASWDDAILRLFLTIPRSIQAHFHEPTVRRLLSGSETGRGASWFNMKIEAPEEAERVRLADPAVESWTTMEALDAYLGLSQADETRRERLRAIAQRLLAERDTTTESVEAEEAVPLRLAMG